MVHGRDPEYNLSLSAELLGEAEQEAELHVVVCCAEPLEGPLNEAFASETLQNLLQLPRSNEILKYLVVPDPPKNLNAQLGIHVASQKSFATIHGTHCGAPISVQDPDTNMFAGMRRFATFGGIIKVAYGNGDTHYYGMTAGHLINAQQQRKPLDAAVETDCSTGKSDLDGFAGAVTIDCTLGHPLDPQKLPGVTANRAALGYDWCLFGVSDPHPNRAIHPRAGMHGESSDDISSHHILVAQTPHFEDDMSDTVLLLGASAHTRRGELSSTTARLWLAHSQDFVDAYMLETYDDGGRSLNQSSKSVSLIKTRNT